MRNLKALVLHPAPVRLLIAMIDRNRLRRQHHQMALARRHRPVGANNPTSSIGAACENSSVRRSKTGVPCGDSHRRRRDSQQSPSPPVSPAPAAPPQPTSPARRLRQRHAAQSSLHRLPACVRIVTPSSLNASCSALPNRGNLARRNRRIIPNTQRNRTRPGQRGNLVSQFRRRRRPSCPPPAARRSPRKREPSRANRSRIAKPPRSSFDAADYIPRCHLLFPASINLND